MSDLDLIYGTKPKTTPPPVKGKTGAPISPLISPAKRKPQKIKSQTQVSSQSTGQSASQSISQPTSPQVSKIVDRPKAFYITVGLDEKLDKAVEYLQKKHGIKKVDRSTIMNALLDNDTLWTDDALDQLVERVVSQLTSRLISR